MYLRRAVLILRKSSSKHETNGVLRVSRVIRSEFLNQKDLHVYRAL